MAQRPIDYAEFRVGCMVKFVGIGRGSIVERLVREDKLYLSVKFEGATEPHLCRPDELEIIKWKRKRL